MDQFGVLHDGRRPYAGSVEALEYLHKQKLSVYLLSNSSQRSLTAYGRLEAMGFKREWITGAEIFAVMYLSLCFRHCHKWGDYLSESASQRWQALEEHGKALHAFHMEVSWQSPAQGSQSPGTADLCCCGLKICLGCDRGSRC